MPTFLDLDEDVHHIILSTLPKNCLLSLAVTCKSLKTLTTPYLYRKVTLSKSSSSSHIIVRLLRGDDIAKYIRHLEIVDIPQGSGIINEILEKIDNLHQFSWNTPELVSSQTLHLLQRKFPIVQISARNHNRTKIVSGMRKSRPFDVQLLSSPQLAELDYTVHSERGKSSTGLDFSEWLELSRILLKRERKDTGLKKLRLTPCDGYIEASEWFREGKTGLNFQQDDRFAELVELSITPEYSAIYTFDPEHCQDLLRAIDFTKVQVLNLGSLKPKHLFSQLVDLSPISLTSLTFTAGYDEDSIDTTTHFLASLSNIKHLCIANLDHQITTLWSSILLHQNQLESLFLRPSRRDYSPHPLQLSYLKTLATKFPKIRNFGVAIPFISKELFLSYQNKPINISAYQTSAEIRTRVKRSQEEEWTLGPYGLDVDYMRLIGSMKLQTLELFLGLPTYDTPFKDKTCVRESLRLDIEIDKDVCVRFAWELWGKISANFKGGEEHEHLRRLDLRFNGCHFDERLDPGVFTSDFKLKRVERYGEGQWVIRQ